MKLFLCIVSMAKTWINVYSVLTRVFWFVGVSECPWFYISSILMQRNKGVSVIYRSAFLHHWKTWVIKGSGYYMKTEEIHLPHIGMRIIKSALGVLLCFVIYFLRGKQGAPFYSALAVLWCIQNQTRNTLGNALQRTIGTAIGAVYGLIFILAKIKLPEIPHIYLSIITRFIYVILLR